MYSDNTLKTDLDNNPKIPPYNQEAEESVLGASLLTVDSLLVVMDMLTSDDFYFRNHQIIFSAISDLQKRSQPVDLITVTQKLREQNHLEAVGGSHGIARLTEQVPTSAHVEHYSRIVKELGTRRKIIEAATAVVRDGYAHDMPLREYVDYTQKRIFEATSSQQDNQGFEILKDIMLTHFRSIELAFERQETVSGIPSGFRDLDNKTTGFQRSDLVIIAARPGMGKTAFVLNIAANAAKLAGAHVAIFSMEMSKDQLVARLLNSEALVDNHKVKTGRLDQNDWRKLAHGAAKLSELNIYIDDTPGVSIYDVKNKCRKLALEKGKLDMVIIDYIQLMQGSKSLRNSNREQEISEISRSLKGMARELNLPVLALSQLNRSLEQRPNKRPLPSDLRESGSLEQDADQIYFIYRDDYYNPDTENKGVAEILISKNRHGESGNVNLRWFGNFTRFDNVDVRLLEE